MLTTVVDTTASGADVVRLERQTCVAGALGAAVTYDAGCWKVGRRNGTGRSAAINMKTAKSVGINISGAILLRADKVIN